MLIGPEGSAPSTERPESSGRYRKTGIVVVALLLVWGFVSYLLMPELWTRYFKKHPQLGDVPDITHTGNGLPGDPLNSALVGTQAEVIRALLAAGWFPADPLSFKSSLEIAEASVLGRPYPKAPVSNLYLFGRKEDLAFEKEDGNSPRHRHHVRFWKSEKHDNQDRPYWLGSAVYDLRVGLSRETGAVTHVTAPDVDAERNFLFADLEHGGDLIDFYEVDGFHKVLEGKNGGGDPWRTDGRLFVGVTRPETVPAKNKSAPATASEDSAQQENRQR